ncbi:MAG: hypothetical protein QY312_01070 [Candidatus Dojkabacteria bacterium]|nr:MAG: hypothetical protein QY312_01070 [Candidatus Dojkabacteria bacterium]
MKKFFSILLIVVGILVVTTTVVGFVVAQKIKSGEFSLPSFLSMFNNSASIDLGITYTEEEVLEVHEKMQSSAKVVTDESPECRRYECIPGNAIYVGGQRIEVELTNSVATGLINEWIQLSPNAPFTSAQMRVNNDGSVDFAGIVDMKQVQNYAKASKIPQATLDMATKYVGALGETFPVRASGTLTIKNNAVDANFTKFQVGIIAIPSSMLSTYKGEVDSFVEERLAVVQKSFSIEELSFADGKTIYKGTVPKEVLFVK